MRVRQADKRRALPPRVFLRREGSKVQDKRGADAFQFGKCGANGSPGIFGQECASCVGESSWVISEKWKSAEEIENKERSVLAEAGKKRIAARVFERASSVHVGVYILGTDCQVV